MRAELVGDDPFAIWEAWFVAASASEPNDPNAVALATCSRDGVPSVRMVLVKGVTQSGFRFFTSGGSRKGRELEENPRASLCFHWKSLRRQVRVSGRVEMLPDAVAADYFHSRSHASQMAAVISDQSQPLADRTVMEQRFRDYAAQHAEGEVVKPADWNGYLVVPQSIEFWMDGKDRMHDRRLFTAGDAGWTSTLLYP